MGILDRLKKGSNKQEEKQQVKQENIVVKPEPKPIVQEVKDKYLAPENEPEWLMQLRKSKNKRG